MCQEVERDTYQFEIISCHTSPQKGKRKRHFRLSNARNHIDPFHYVNTFSIVSCGGN